MRRIDYDEESAMLVRAWLKDASEDGWTIKKTYNSEPMEAAATLEKEGFRAMTLARPPQRLGLKWAANISVWGPDGLAIEVGSVYNWDEIQLGVNRCNYCNAHPVETHRVSFAGRCCEQCLPERRKVLEFPGWED